MLPSSKLQVENEGIQKEPEGRGGREFKEGKQGPKRRGTNTPFQKK